MKRIFLDHASSSPLTKAAAKAYAKALPLFGNPSAVHSEGRAARAAITAARVQTAAALSVKPDELIFTSGGTEANNLAIVGVVRALRREGVPYTKMHCITSSIEHASVLETFSILEEDGVRVTYVDPGTDGVIRGTSVLEHITPETVIISLAHVNSETGTIQPIPELGADLLKLKKGFDSAFAKVAPGAPFPLLHVDAAQSPLYLDASPHALRADMVTYDAQKIGGPKGVGILYRDFSVPLKAVTGGGTQERSLRPGTENTPAIVAAGAAFQAMGKDRKKLSKKVAALRDHLVKEVMTLVPGALLLGSATRRIANNAFFVIPGVDGDYLSVTMDSLGVSVSPRSACVGSGGGTSHVAFVLTKNEEYARSTIRFTLGPTTAKADVQAAVRALRKALSISKTR